jgi:hypothetical protein
MSAVYLWARNTTTQKSGWVTEVREYPEPTCSMSKDIEMATEYKEDEAREYKRMLGQRHRIYILERK